MKSILSLIFAFTLTLSSFADSPFDTSITVTQTEAIIAKSATIEQVSDGVAVFLEKPEPSKQLGVVLTVKSTAKFVAVRATPINSTRQVRVNRLTNGGYYFFGQPGKYAITVIESDPEKGINFNDVEAEIVGTTQSPSDPDRPPDETEGDFSSLVKITKASAAKLNDPTTAKRLAAAYKKAVASMAKLSELDTCKALGTEARREVLRTREGSSLTVDWNSFLVAVDVELIKVAKSVDSYRAALLAISNALEN